MILNWKKPRAGVNVIPCILNGKVIKKIMLLPGYNEIDDKDWNMIKDNVQKLIDRGFLEVVSKKVEVKQKVKVKVKDEKTGKEKEVMKDKVVTIDEPVKIKDLEANKAREVIADTFVLETLEAWLKVEGRDEIRALIQNQIEAVKNPEIKGKRKK